MRTDKKLKNMAAKGQNGCIHSFNGNELVADPDDHNPNTQCSKTSLMIESGKFNFSSRPQAQDARCLPEIYQSPLQRKNCNLCSPSVR
jgi:hypothetical protein